MGAAYSILGMDDCALLVVECFICVGVFSLPQHPKQGINRAAELLHARVIDLDPYTEEYTQNILQTAHFFREAMNDKFSD